MIGASKKGGRARRQVLIILIYYRKTVHSGFRGFSCFFGRFSFKNIISALRYTGKFLVYRYFLKSDTDIPVLDSIPVFSVYRYIEHPYSPCRIFRDFLRTIDWCIKFIHSYFPYAELSEIFLRIIQSTLIFELMHFLYTLHCT